MKKIIVSFCCIIVILLLIFVICKLINKNENYVYKGLKLITNNELNVSINKRYPKDEVSIEFEMFNSSSEERQYKIKFESISNELYSIDDLIYIIDGKSNGKNDAYNVQDRFPIERNNLITPIIKIAPKEKHKYVIILKSESNKKLIGDFGMMINFEEIIENK